MTSNAGERNEKIHKLLVQLLREGKKNRAVISDTLKDEVESLFTTHIWGHREIVLTIIMGMLFDHRYHASKDLYACNPRSIYEKPIRTFFREHGIPHKKSGPLNVAKNSKRISNEWANNKRGDDIAKNVVRIVKTLETMDRNELEYFASAYIVRYAKEAGRVKRLSYTPTASEDPIQLSNLAETLIVNVPDGGATPQIIVGLLIETANKNRGNAVTVSGHLDSVSTTNTTSKKSGDIIEQLPSGNLVYEITVKKFDADRLRESYEAIKANPNTANVQQVFVISRPQDVHPEAASLGSSIILGLLVHEDVVYYFVNLFEWIRSTLLFMTPKGRAVFHNALIDHINETNTSEKVKLYFKNYYEKN